MTLRPRRPHCPPASYFGLVLFVVGFAVLCVGLFWLYGLALYTLLSVASDILNSAP